MKHNPDLYRAYLAARDLSTELLLAYSEDLYRGNGPSSVRTEEVDRQFRDMAKSLGFEIARPEPSTPQEAA